MKIRLTPLFIISSLLLLTSCYTNFHLKEDIEIPELSFHISYDSSLEKSDVEQLKFNTQQFVQEYQQHNPNDIKLNLSSSQNQADISLHVEKVLIPKKGVKILGYAISAGTIVWIATNPKVGTYFWPFAYFNTSTSTTRIEYKVNPKYASFPSSKQRALFRTSRKWQKVEAEKKLHLKHFDALLAEFFSHLNREYHKVQVKE